MGILGYVGHLKKLKISSLIGIGKVQINSLKELSYMYHHFSTKKLGKIWIFF
jgi:hypothetical protein